jgi:hypothetical protein
MMSEEIRSLLEAAAKRDHVYAPDVEQLLVRGRREVRRRYAVSVAVAASVAIVAGAAVATAVGNGLPAPNTGYQPAATGSTTGRQSPNSAQTPSAADAQVASDCSKQRDATSIIPLKSGDRTPDPAPSEVKGWKTAVKAVDSSGTSAVLLSPDGRFYAVCSYPPANWNGGVGHKGIDILPVGAAPALPTGSQDGISPIGWANDCSAKRGGPCEHEAWGGAGRVPAGVARVTVRTRDGFTGEATIRDGYLAYQHLAPYQPMTSTRPAPVVLTMYDAEGKILVSYDQGGP